MSTQAEPPSREGELLAQKYRLEKRLGTGGQGEVYRARNELIGREVAIKLLRGEWGQDPTTVTRFIREARAANMVRHPNVVDVLDIGKDDNGAPFIVQELLAGQTLDDYLDSRGGRLLPPEVYDLAIPVCEGVGAGHARGVVHRDLKPGNIFLVKSGATFIPKVLDFGLAKVSEQHGETDVTTTGAWFGTPAYMPPEQIRHTRTVDARSDVWALGVLLYEMLAGRRPFDSHTVGDLFVVICTEDPISLREFAPHVSESLARVVHRCIVRDPERRYANAAELAKDLQAARSGGALLEVTADPQQRNPANDVVTAKPGRSDRPEPIDASEAIDDTRIRGEPLESQKTKPVTPRGGDKPITPLKDAVAKSETLQATPLESEPKVIDPIEAKRSPASASGELVASRPSSTAPPAEISTSGSRAAESRSRARTWVAAVATSVAVVAIAGFIGLRSHDSATPSAAVPPSGHESAPPAPHAASPAQLAHDPEPSPPSHVDAPSPSVAPTVAVRANTAAVPATPANDPHGSHHAHHASAATSHAAATTATNSSATTHAASTPAANTQPAGALPTHEMHGATRYEP